MNKAFEPAVGFVMGVVTTIDGWQFCYTLLMAFASAIVAWLGRELCSWIKTKLKQRNDG